MDPRIHIVREKGEPASAGPRQPASSSSTFLYMDGMFSIEKIYTCARQVPLHTHSCYELELCLTGASQNHFIQQQMEMRRGALILISPAEAHRITCPGTCEILNLKFTATDLTAAGKELLGALSFPFCAYLDEETVLRAEAHLQLLQQELAQADARLSRLLACNYLDWLLPSVMHNAIVSTALHPAPSHAKMLQGLEYVRQNYKRRLTLSEAARHCGYSPNHFGLLFHDMTGMKFSEYVCHERLQYACSLLSNTALSIGEISEQSGFDSPAYFSRCFLQAYSCTPSRYRLCQQESPPHAISGEST